MVRIQQSKKLRRRQLEKKVERLQKTVEKLKKELEKKMKARINKKETRKRDLVAELMDTKLALSEAQDEIDNLKYQLEQKDLQVERFSGALDAEKTISKAAWAGQATALLTVKQQRAALTGAGLVIMALALALFLK